MTRYLPRNSLSNIRPQKRPHDQEVWTRYRLILSGMEIAQMGDARAKRVIKVWAEESGVLNVPKSGVIEALAEIDKDWVIYTAHFNSSAWTGI